MKRRTYLATVATAASAAAFAGCTGSPAGSDGDGGTTDDSTTTRDETTDENTTTDGDPDGSFPYAIDGVQADDAPVENVTMDVTITQEFSADSPARLEVSFTNDADESRTFQFGSLVPWDGLRGQHTSSTASLLLAPNDGVVPDESGDGCWQATDGVVLAQVMREETLDAGETVTGEFPVVAAHDSEECHPAGTYRFGKENYLESGWGFDVDITAVEE